MTAATEFAAMTDEELEGRLDESRRELFNLRFQLATGQLDNPSRLSVVRKDVARILTFLRQREISESDAIAAADALEQGPIYEPPTRAAKAQADEDKGATDAAPADDADAADDEDHEEDQA